MSESTTHPDGSTPGAVFPFGYALQCLEGGYQVTRDGWGSNNVYLELQVPDAHSKMTQPYIYMKMVDGILVPWLPGQLDLLAHDWHILPNHHLPYPR